MEFGFKRLNECRASPTRVVRKTQHFTSSLYWCSTKAFSKWQRWSSRSEASLYSPICRGQKWLDNSSVKTPSVKGVSLWVVIKFFLSWWFPRGLPRSSDGRSRAIDSRDYSSHEANVSPSIYVGEGIDMGCCWSNSSTVVVTILIRFSTVQAARALDAGRIFLCLH